MKFNYLHLSRVILFILSFGLLSNNVFSLETNSYNENIMVGDSNKIVVNKNYQGLFYLDFAFVANEEFMSWTNASLTMSKEEYASYLKNWIIANPSKYAQLISNRISLNRFTSEDLLKYTPEQASIIKSNIELFGPVLMMQKKLNENFPSVSEVQNQFGEIVYYTGLIHIDDLHFFLK